MSDLDWMQEWMQSNYTARLCGRQFHFPNPPMGRLSNLIERLPYNPDQLALPAQERIQHTDRSFELKNL